MAKKEKNEKEYTTEDLAFRRRNLQSATRRNGFRAGDLLILLLAVSVTALMIFIGAKVIPAIRESFSSYNEEVYFTVEYPMLPGDHLPKTGDAWMLMDADKARCTVMSVECSEDMGSCRVVLLRKNAIFREGEGYLIEDIRIAVGSTLYFSGINNRYFTATVQSINSARFPLVTEPVTEPPEESSFFETSGEDVSEPSEDSNVAESTEPEETIDTESDITAAVTEEGSTNE